MIQLQDHQHNQLWEPIQTNIKHIYFYKLISYYPSEKNLSNITKLRVFLLYCKINGWIGNDIFIKGLN